VGVPGGVAAGSAPARASSSVGIRLMRLGKVDEAISASAGTFVNDITLNGTAGKAATDLQQLQTFYQAAGFERSSFSFSLLNFLK
jgi:hypothetical protein